MPQYRYQSLSNSGKALSGVVDAPDRQSVVRVLQRRGETATSIEEAGAKLNGRSNGRAARTSAPTSTTAEAGGRTMFGRRIGRSLSRAEMANLVREVATALEAGLPLMQSLRTVRQQTTQPAMLSVLDHLIERVEAGAPLYQAAREYGPPFDDMIVGMMRAADASGAMSDVLHQLAELLDRSVELRREVMGATLYPMIVVGLVLLSIVFLATVLIPNLIAPLAGDIDMPLPTIIVLAGASFLSSYWFWCLAGVVVLVFAWRAWVKVPANRFILDTAILKAPLLGRLMRDVAVARFTRTLGTLVTSGLPILEALRITKGTLGNTAMMSAIDQVQEQVTAGKSLADPLERSGHFPPLLIQIVNLGERSGRLESMLMHAATAFDRQVNNSIKIFTKALPPVLLLFIAAIVAFVLAAILLPLLELQSAIGG